MRSVWSRLATLAVVGLGLSAGLGQVEAACNGHDEYCSRRYSNVSLVGAHNSYAVAQGNLAANQNFTVQTQLNNGIRFLQIQGHSATGGIHLCHTSCSLLDAGPLETYLSTVKTWLDSNPDEVVTLLMVNIDNVAIATWASAFTSSGIDRYAFVPTSTPVALNAWPTYQELITSGKRLVTFIDNGADVSSVNYILDEFSHIWETPYNAMNQSFPCTVDRGSPPAGKMYLINHMLHVPLNINLGTDAYLIDTARLGETNAASGTGSLGLQAQQCAAEWGSYPNFMLVDYYDVGGGSVFEVEARNNGVTYQAATIGNGTTTSSGSGSGSGNSTSGNGSGSRNGGSGTGAASTHSQSMGVMVGLIGAGLLFLALA